jgi:hypothetical protein
LENDAQLRIVVARGFQALNDLVKARGGVAELAECRRVVRIVFLGNGAFDVTITQLLCGG